MAFQKGVSGNAAGRPKVKTTEKPTNRSLRTEAFLRMVRQFKPLQAKALTAAVSIIDNKEAQDANKLRAASLIITTYKELLKDLYDYKYDDEEATPMQEDNKPMFSLKVIGNKDEDKV